MKPSLFGSAVIVCVLLGALVMPARAQTLPQDRAYEYVEIPPFLLAEFSNDVAPVAELYLYAYRSGEWKQIPFQLDERGFEITVDGDTSLNSYFPNAKDGKLDDSDDLLFMAHDAGERAPANDWVPDAAARSFVRYEIKVTDPLTQRQGYVYLYRSNTLPRDPFLPAYVKYAPGPATNPAADTVRGVSYVQGHASNGIPNYITVAPAFGGTGADFIDRLKLRIRAVLPAPFGTQVVDEDKNLVAVAGGIRTVPGRVRVIRQVRERLQIFIFGTPIPVDTLAISLFFYPYSAQLAGEINLTSTLGARLLRASFDFDPNVSNQAWHNQNAGPRIITGTSGSLTPDEAKIVLLPQRNWFTMGSIHGSLTGIFSMEAIPNTTQQFYFHDAQSGSGDGTPDTGDNRSYGDTGFMITSASAIVARFQLGMSAFYLKPDLTRNEAAALSANAETPVQIAANSQSFDGIAPARVNDLRVCFTTDTSAVLSLTAPGDQGSFVKSYEVAYSTEKMGSDTLDWFNRATKTTNLPAPAAPGVLQLLTINGLKRDSIYCFLLRSFDDFGNASALSNLACRIIVSVAEQEAAVEMPERFALAQSHPNPFSLKEAATLIRYELPQTQAVTVALRVYDLLGHEVRRLVKARQGRGSYSVRWDGRDERGLLVPAGIYFYELRAGDLRQVKKLIVVR
jgi:hypothetical protein